ncbi:MAG: thioesterase family protein [Proteobacteria bacterium]|nr:thioesterase family protein [Pseudomonadota bacterium]
MDESGIDLALYYKAIREVSQDSIPFNKLVGMNIVALDAEDVCIQFDMREELIGNIFQGSLHGGVISAVLDTTGGLLATVGLLHQLTGSDPEEIKERFGKVGTIDLRVDYIRPGHGTEFRCTGSILRMGNKVAVTRMELKNEKDALIAVGTGTYMVG